MVRRQECETPQECETRVWDSPFTTASLTSPRKGFGQRLGLQLIRLTMEKQETYRQVWPGRYSDHTLTLHASQAVAEITFDPCLPSCPYQSSSQPIHFSLNHPPVCPFSPFFPPPLLTFSQQMPRLPIPLHLQMPLPSIPHTAARKLSPRSFFPRILPCVGIAGGKPELLQFTFKDFHTLSHLSNHPLTP